MVGTEKETKVSFHFKKPAKKHFAQKWDTKLSSSCAQILRNFLLRQRSVLVMNVIGWSVAFCFAQKKNGYERKSSEKMFVNLLVL